MFYVTIPSNSSFDYYPNNTLTNYYTKLPRVLNFNGEWETGIVELHYPFSWDNIRDDEVFYVFVIRNKSAHESFIIQLDKGYYSSGKILIDALNTSRKKIQSTSKKDIKFIYDPYSHKASLDIFNENIWIELSDSLSDILKLPKQKCLKGLHIGTEKINLIKVDSLYIYSDVSSSTTPRMR